MSLASEMYRVTSERTEPLAVKEFNSIISKIKEVAFEGKYSYETVLEYSITEEKLRAEGFELEICYWDNTVEISWAKPS